MNQIAFSCVTPMRSVQCGKLVEPESSGLVGCEIQVRICHDKHKGPSQPSFSLFTHQSHQVSSKEQLTFSLYIQNEKDFNNWGCLKDMSNPVAIKEIVEVKMAQASNKKSKMKGKGRNEIG